MTRLPPWPAPAPCDERDDGQLWGVTALQRFVIGTVKAVASDQVSGELVELVGTPLAPAAADDALLMYFFVCVGLVACAAGW